MKKIVRTISAILTLIMLAGCSPTVPGDTSDIPADVTPEPTEAIETTAEATTEEETTEEVTTDSMEATTNPYTPLNYEDIKAMWLSQFDLNSVYCSGGLQTSETNYRKMLDKILDNVVNNGFNTVIGQVCLWRAAVCRAGLVFICLSMSEKVKMLFHFLAL